MSDALLVFLGGLVGSLLTMVFSKLLEMKQKSNEHQYTLEKAYFERKLSVAETAISYLQISASSSKSWALLFEKFSNDDAKGWEAFKLINEELSARQVQISDALKAAGSLYLYFDIDDDTSDDRRFLDVIAEIYDYKLSLDVLREIETKFPDPGTKTYIEEQEKELFAQARQKMMEASGLYHDTGIRLERMVKKLRSEMRRYDVR